MLEERQFLTGISEFTLDAANAEPLGISAGPQGTFRFTDAGGRCADFICLSCLNRILTPTAGGSGVAEPSRKARPSPPRCAFSLDR
jgi:hypothetical protein